MKILLIEDNEKLSKYFKKALERDSYSVDVAHDGIDGEYQALTNVYDAIVLDIMLPGKNGLDVCRSVRDHGLSTPIIMMTAKGELEDKIVGLDTGADDYLVKPVALEELQAHVRAVLRRPSEFQADVLNAGKITLDRAKHLVTVDNEEVMLTTKEFAILEVLMRNIDMLISRTQILENCWDFAFDGASNVVDVNIKSLRKKLGGENEEYIETIRGVGYKIKK